MYMQLNAYVLVDPTTDTIPTNATEPITTEPNITDSITTSNSEPANESATASGVLGIYRITLWIIVLLSTILTISLTSDLFL